MGKLMANEDEERKILSELEAIELADKGMDEWNKWSAENPGVAVDFSDHDFTLDRISFEGFIFPGDATFENAKFPTANFKNAIFQGKLTNFTRATFSGKSTTFEKARFINGNVYFGEAIFWSKNTIFAGSKFERGNASFSNARFNNGIINFVNAKFLLGNVDFEKAEFDCEGVSFREIKVPKGEVSFRNTKFIRGKVSFREAEFSGGHANFYETEFNGAHVEFYDAKFSGGEARFYGAKFRGGNAYFRLAQFSGGNANFNYTWFSKQADFSFAKFEHKCSFEGTVFNGPVGLEGSRFKRVPDFRRTTLPTHFTFHDMKVAYVTLAGKLNKWRGKAKNSSDADKFRRLKELAVQARDHEREQDFFAKELKAKRFYETKGLALGWSYGYEWLSDFGRSTLRPLLCLIVIWLGFGVWFGTKAVHFSAHYIESLRDGLILSGALLTPFVAISRTAIRDMQDSLYGEGVSLWWLDIAAIFEGLLGLIFIFLIGLALRNRFRI